MASLRLILNCTRLLIAYNRRLFFLTLSFGLMWRFFLILSYVFSITAIGIAFQPGADHELPFLSSLTADSLIPALTFLVLFFFMATSVSDIVFTRFKGRLVYCYEKQIHHLVEMDGETERKEIRAGREAVSSQILLRCFEISYAFILFVSTLLLFSIISVYLVAGLIVLITIAGICLIFLKKKSTVAINKIIKTGSYTQLTQQKLLRSALIRAVSMSIAGVFLAALIWLLGHGALQSIDIVQIAIIAFCVRFLISFFIILVVNLSTLLDSHTLLTEFYSMHQHSLD